MKNFLRRFVYLSLLLAVALSVASRARVLKWEPSAAPLRPADETARAKAHEAYGKLPLSFEANQGQTDGQIKFLSRGGNYNFLFASTEATLELRDGGDLTHQPATLRMKFAGANPAPRIEGLDELPGKSNYLIGADPQAWRTNIPNYARVRYDEVWPGIDVVFYGNQRQLEYDFRIAPGTSPRAIRLSFESAKKISVDASGDLILRLAEGELRQRKPVVYQEANGERRVITSRYIIRGEREVGFEVAAYDRSRTLVIDPTLVYSTGGIGGSGITVDSGGNVYVIGATTANDFPVTNPLQPQRGGGEDVYVAKLNAEGSALIYSTYLGGGGNDQGSRIAVDASGDVYLTGSTESPDFPGANNGFGNRVFFKSGDGGGNWAGNHSGLPYVETYALAVNPQNPSIIYLATGGSRRVFKSTDGGSNWAAADAGLTGVVRSLIVDPLNPSVLYASVDGPAIFKTTDGGANWTSLNVGLPPNPFSPASLAVSPSRPATLYAAARFPIIYKSANGGADWTAINTNLDDSSDVKSLAVDPTNPDVVYAGDPASVYKSVDGGLSWNRAANGLIGGANSLVIDPANPSTLYAGGSQGVFKSADGGGNWAPANVGLPASSPSVNPLVIDPVNRSTLYAVVSFGSDRGIFKTTDGGGTWNAASKGLPAGGISALAIDPRNPATVYSSMRLTGSDAFVAKLNASGAAIVYSRYLGGVGNDRGADIAVNSSGEVYVTGTTTSENFPVTPNARQPMLAGNPRVFSDAFVTKLAVTGALSFSTYLGGNNSDRGVGIALDAQGRAYVIGSTTSSDFPTKNALQPTLGSSQGSAFVAELDANQAGPASLLYSTYLNRENGSVGTDIAVDADGNIYALLAPILALRGTLFVTQSPGLGVVMKLNPTSAAPVYTVQLGSVYAEPVTTINTFFVDHPDQFNSLAVDPAGNVYLTGASHVGATSLATPGAFQPTHGNSGVGRCIRFSPHTQTYCFDAFVMKLNATGSALVYSSYLGGSTTDSGQGIAVDATGNAYVTGGSNEISQGNSSSFPTTPGALPTAPNRGFTARISADNRSTAFGSFSAASYARPPLAVESIAAGFGSGLTTITAAGASPLPTQLVGAQVLIKDSSGTERLAPLFFASPTQINYQIRPGTAIGPATVIVKNGEVVVATGQLEVVSVVPALFTANASGSGVVAAVAQRVKADNSQVYETISRFDQSLGQWVLIPIDLGPESDQVFLAIFGTGWRFRSSEAAVKVTIGEVDAPVTYAGLQPTLVGVDQINARLPRSLAGKGEVDLVVMVDGKTANTTRVAFK